MGKLRPRVTWSDLWRFDNGHLRFQIQAVYDVLPSPSNLHTWVKSPVIYAGEDDLFICTLDALSERRYYWRQDQVLKAIAEVVAEALKSDEVRLGRLKINFVRAGRKKQEQIKSKARLLSSTLDWHLLVDLIKQIKFPAHIVVTRLRSDIILYSDSTKKVIVWELSVPSEENMESTHERMIAKYQPLVEQCCVKGWQAPPVKQSGWGVAGLMQGP